ncbi:hypothetical protein S83_001603, partial [Arachis hypogaea]
EVGNGSWDSWFLPLSEQTNIVCEKMIRIPAVLCSYQGVLKWRRHNGMAWRVLTLPPFTGRRDGVITGAPWRPQLRWRHGGTQYIWRKWRAPSSIAAVRRAVRGAVRRAAKRATQRAAHLCSLNAAAHHLLTLLYTMSTSNAPTPASAGPTVGAAPVGPAPAAAVRSNRVDPGWKYISTVEEGNTNEYVIFVEKLRKEASHGQKST